MAVRRGLRLFAVAVACASLVASQEAADANAILEPPLNAPKDLADGAKIPKVPCGPCLLTALTHPATRFHAGCRPLVDHHGG